MSTPLPADGQQEAPGWCAHDLTPEAVAPFLERFRSKYVPGDPDDCWGWLGYKYPSGYGALPNSRRNEQGRRGHLLAHRIAWVAATGKPLLGNLTIDHLCRRVDCVNPSHLEPVTMVENARRGAAHRPRRTPEEAAEHARLINRRRYREEREKRQARKNVRKPCQYCDGLYRSANLARHRRVCPLRSA